MTTRRTFLSSLGALTLVPVGVANAKEQVLGVYRRRIGNITLTALLDGFIELDPNMLTGADPLVTKALMDAAFLPSDKMAAPINAYVIQTGARTILVDGGASTAFGPTAGKLRVALAAAGIASADVDTLFCTHLHPDHIGAFARYGMPVFPNAELVTSEIEHGFWLDQSNFTGAPEQVLSFAAMAQDAVTAYEGKTTLIGDGAEIAAGVTAIHLPGHTPGHTGLLLSSGEDTLLLWGDIVHIGPIQFARPELTIPFDVDQRMAANTRARVLDMVSKDRVEIAGSHIDFPSFGHVERVGASFRFRPARWEYAL